jgi:4,5-DOPA dioxygenase extradiol
MYEPKYLAYKQSALSMSPLPSLFISHGSPDMPLHPSPVLDFLKGLGTKLSKPKTILVVSAHWLTGVPTVSVAPEVKTIHDFWGFPKEIDQLQYPVPGAPALAKRVIQLLTQAGLDAAVHPTRGLDHGAWEPLLLMYPDADIPVTQLSLQPQLGTAHHLQLGRAIAPLREEGVLILASGGTTHNLSAFGEYGLHSPPPDWVKQFDDWLREAIATHNIETLLDYRNQAPYATQNHPTEEHLLPLFVALGAGGETASQLHRSFTYGILSMAAYGFS